MGRMRKRIHRATLSRIKTIAIPEGVNITGCARIFYFGYFVVDRNNKRLALLNDEGVYLKDIVKFTNNPLDVCSIGISKLAVTIPTDHMVVFVDTKTCKIVETVVYRQKCCYIKFDGTYLFIGCPNISRIIIADKHGREIRSLNIQGERFAIDHLNIYITNENEDLVSCYDKYGNQKWIAPDTVRDPIGISISYDFVTVLSKHNAVYILSRNGYENRLVLNMEHGLEDPVFMHSSVGWAQELIVVCNKSNTQANAYLLS